MLSLDDREKSNPLVCFCSLASDAEVLLYFFDEELAKNVQVIFECEVTSVTLLPQIRFGAGIKKSCRDSVFLLQMQAKGRR